MADSELVKALDYILNRSNEADIEVIAQAVVRRRRDLTIFHATGSIGDPAKMAEEIAKQINASAGFSLESMRNQIREMMLRIIREHAPELTDAQAEELSRSWLSQPSQTDKENIPRDALISMIEQFISFSHGTMQKSVDEALRGEMGEWPQRYWNAFPPVIRQLISDYLKEKISSEEFNSRIGIALEI